jgi:hypothetical protein
MIAALVGIVGAIAVGAWLVAVWSLFRMVTLVPKGQRIATIFSAGFWQFEKARAVTNNAIDPYIRRFGWAFAVFFFAIFAGMALGIVGASMSRSA